MTGINLNTLLLGLLNLFSLALLVAAVRLGVMYGRDSQRLLAVERQVSSVDEKGTTILGNGHPGPFVPRDVFEPLADEVDRHRSKLHDLSNSHMRLEGRVLVLEKET